MMLLSLAAMTGCSKNDQSLEGIKKSGKLVVYTEAGFAPFEFIAGGKVVGVDIAICEKSHFYILGDKDGQGALVRLESSGETYTMHVTGGDLWDKILAISTDGTSKSPNVGATDSE